MANYSFNAANMAALDDAARRRHAQQFRGMNAYDRHKQMVHDLVTYYGGTLPTSLDPTAAVPASIKTDLDVLKEGYRFIRSTSDDAEGSWEVRLAKRYYSRLFKEYALADVSRYKEGKLGLRWRTQKEVVQGKGQFMCGALGCEERRGLASFEVPFGYVEAGERKQALVKVRMCPTHAYQLNYKKHLEADQAQQDKDEVRAKKKSSKKKKRRGRSRSDTDDSDGEEEERSRDRKRRENSNKKKDRDGSEQQKDAQQQREKGKKGSDEFEEFFEGMFE